MDLRDDNACARRVVDLGQPELQAQIYNRNHLTPQIEYSFDISGHLRNSGDFLNAHDFPHTHDLDCEFFVPEAESQVLAGSVVRLLGSWDALRYGCHGVLS